MVSCVTDTGVVTLTKPISGNSSFLATASDGGLPRRQATVPVYVYVLPVNRHAPRFVGGQQAFTATVAEDRPVGYVFGRVSAVDRDRGVNGLVRYHITSADDDAGFFSVDAVGGTLALARSLDYEIRRRFDIQLTARDLGVGGQSLEDRRVFTVMVADVNDHPPEFTRAIYTMSVDQDAGAGTILGRLDASDSDRGLNADVRFQLVSGNASDVVDVGPLDGSVKITTTGTRPLAPGLYVSVVEAGNPGTNLSSTATLLVRVRPLNRRAPMFRRREYVFTLPNVTVLSAGLVIGAVDVLPADWDEVLYSMVANSNLGVFSVDRRTGVLSVTVTTATSNLATTTLSVMAKHRGPLRPGNFDVCRVVLRGGGGDGRLTLTFDRDLYTATVREDAYVGDAVLKVSAFIVNPGTLTTSPGAARPVVFAIVAGNVGQAFSIESRTGLIRVARKLRHDSLSKYNLTVSAYVNSGHPLTGINIVIRRNNSVKRGKQENKHLIITQLVSTVFKMGRKCGTI